MQAETSKSKNAFATSFIFMAFLFLVFTGSNLRIGGVMLRYIFALLLIMEIVILKLKLYLDKSLLVFLLFIFFFGISCFVTGFEREFISKLYYSYFIALLGFVLVLALLKKDASLIKYITYLILAIGAFDVVVTYSQFVFKEDWYRPIEQLLQFPTWDVLEDVRDRKELKLEAMDMTLPGILGNGVYNGYFLSVCTALSMVFVIRSKKAVYYIIPFFYLLGAFFCQQRAPLFISVFVIAMMSIRLFKEFNKGSRIVFFIFFSVGVVMAFSMLSNISELFGLRYSSTGFDSTGRDSISANTIDYIMSHPFIANAYELILVKGHMPHNFFLNAYVYGGIISFILIMYILFVQIKTFFKIIHGDVDGLNAYFYVFAWAWAVFTLNCMAHNRSIITGDYLIWMIWGVMLAYPSLHSKSFIILKI